MAYDYSTGYHPDLASLNPPLADILVSICEDALLRGTEECDDGNSDREDG
jgi:hypothetical protein